MQRLRRCLSLAITALAIGLPAAGVAAADPASVMIVVDGSGSMAGLLEPKGRQTKVVMVREALRSALGDASPQTRIGMAVFGHRHGGCNDVQITRQPQPADAGALMAPLAQLRPRGRGPIATALREAAKQLPGGDAAGPRSLVLIHDGADNCQQDVCAAAAALNTAGIAAHVVSLGTSADDLSKMACVAQVTGGRHFKTDTPEQVETAIAEAVRTASSEAAAVGLAVGAPPVPAAGPAALHLMALWAPKMEPLAIPLHWTVARKNAPDTALFDGWTANPVVPIEPGDYVVTVRGELLSASQTVAVRDDRPVAVPIVLGAGQVRTRVLTQRGNALLADAVVTVSTTDGAPLAAFKAAEGATLLPPGRYHITAELGQARTARAAIVAEGRTTQVDLALNVGRLQLTAAARDGEASLEAPLFIVMEDDPPRGRREVARSATSQAEFVLPPGTYYVVARQGGVEARERLAIGPGDVVRRALGAAVGHLDLSTVSPGVLAGGHVSYTVRRTDDPDQDATWTSRPAPRLSLPAGRYRVEGRYGMTNVVAAREVEIKAGQTTQLAIEHQAATLRVRLTGIGAALADVAWEVRDDAGRTVWGSSQAEDAAVVQAGRYRVIADANARHEEHSVELRPGDSATVQIRAE